MGCRNDGQWEHAVAASAKSAVVLTKKRKVYIPCPGYKYKRYKVGKLIGVVDRIVPRLISKKRKGRLKAEPKKAFSCES